MVAANDMTERERQEERLRENERAAAAGTADRRHRLVDDRADKRTRRLVRTLYDIWGWDPGSLPTLESWRASIDAETGRA